jgi:hypothetical protein
VYKSLIVPGIPFWLSIRTWYPQFDTGPRWGHSRGRCKEHEFHARLFKWQLKVSGRGRRYRDLVGLNIKNPDGYIDWLLDEFGASFNELAIASLRYHMDYSVVWCHPDRRAKYQDLIDRLSEKRPDICGTEEQREIFDAWHADDLSRESITAWLNTPTPPEIQEIYDDYYRRTDEYHDRINKARHDFVDVMPFLSS